MLTAPKHERRLRDLVLAETGSLGVRRVTATCTTLPRGLTDIRSGSSTVPHSAKPEHDDVVAAAT
ncbi:hypothetical protein AB0N97_33750 [Streptomyces collinus]|uniref:hypothetical protein n=1 Tax=Streptomyces collinus TaxID=42684 RepID=UPI0034396A23